MLKIDYKSRVLGLDILRAFAIVTVMYNHGWIYSGKFMSRAKYDVFHFDGVTLFFVLSGFLIGGILFKNIEKKGANFASLKEFWLRRWFRTLPLYYLILSFLVIKLAFAIVSFNELLPCFKYFLFLQNFFTLKSDFFAESWSLAVEEWFYIILPLVIWILVGALKADLKKTVPYIILFFIIGCLALRIVKFNAHETEIVLGQKLTDKFSFTVLCRLDSLMFGILCAYLFKYFNQLWINYKGLFFILGITILLIDYVFYNHAVFFKDGNILTMSLYRNVFHYSVLPLAVAMIIPWFYFFETKFMIGNLFIFISVISYSLYLTHLSVVALLKLPERATGLLPFSGLSKNVGAYLFYWLFSIIIATVLFRFYEKPMTDLREKLAKD